MVQQCTRINRLIQELKLTIDVSVVRVSSVDCPIVNVIDVSKLPPALTSIPKIDVDISVLIPSVSDSSIPNEIELVLDEEEVVVYEYPPFAPTNEI